MSTKHTPGPWKASFTKLSEVQAENGALIARCNKLNSLTNLQANARRIVACVNACEGISTENLEQNRPVLWVVQQYNAAIKQRDELLEALHQIAAIRKKAKKEHCDNVFNAEAEQIAKAAIAKATGEPQ